MSIFWFDVLLLIFVLPFEPILNGVRIDWSKIRTKLESQAQVVESQMKSHQQQGEERSLILGDSLQQTMDSMSFTQDRMKKQFECLKEDIEA